MLYVATIFASTSLAFLTDDVVLLILQLTLRFIIQLAHLTKLVVFGHSLLTHDCLGYFLGLVQFLLDSHLSSDFCLQDLFRDSGIDGHYPIFFLFEFFLSDWWLFEIMLFLIFTKPFGQIIMIFKIISSIRIFNDLFSRSVSQHFLGNCQGFSKLIDIIILHLSLFDDLNLSTDILSFIDILLELLFLLFFVSFEHLSSFLHIRDRLRNDIGVIIRQLPVHLLVRIYCSIIIFFLIRRNVEIFIINICQWILESNLIHFQRFLLFLFLIFFHIHSFRFLFDQRRICSHLSGFQLLLLMEESLFFSIFSLLSIVSDQLLFLFLYLLLGLIHLFKMHLHLFFIENGELSLLLFGLNHFNFFLVLKFFHFAIEDITNIFSELVLIMMVLFISNLGLNHELTSFGLFLFDSLYFSSLGLNNFLLKFSLRIKLFLLLLAFQLIGLILNLFGLLLIKVMLDLSSPFQNRTYLSLSYDFEIQEQFIDIFRHVFYQVIVFGPLVRSHSDSIEFGKDQQGIFSLYQACQSGLLVQMHRRIVFIATSFSSILQQLVDAGDLSGQLIMEMISLSIFEDPFGIKELLVDHAWGQISSTNHKDLSG